MAESTPALQIAEALRAGSFDPQHAGDLFLRADAEKAIRAALGAGAKIAVAGRDAGEVRPVGFMGARFAPDLVAEAEGHRIAVTIPRLRNDRAPIAGTRAGALVFSGRSPAVVAFILDRRLAKADPFADPDDSREVRG